VPHHGLEVALVGELHDQHAPRRQHAGELGEGGIGILEVVEDADADEGVEAGVLEGQVIRVPQLHPPAHALSHRLARRRHVGLRGVHKGHPAPTAVLVEQPPIARADLEQALAPSRQQGAQGEAVGPILVGPLGPEHVTVGEVGVARDVAPGVRLGHAPVS
jgi:hypothetical protein